MAINTKDFMKYSNVVSCKYEFHYKDLDKVYNDFINTILKNKLEPRGLGFYSILNLPMDEMVIGEIFMQVDKSLITDLEGLKFHSYYSIENMLSMCVYENIDENSQYCVGMLLDYMEKNNMLQTSPIFYVLGGDRDFNYTFIKVGATKNNEIEESNE